MTQYDDHFLASVTGQTEAHLGPDPESGRLIHVEVIEPFSALRNAALNAGFELAIASSFRSFERQCLIWNEKAEGRRPVLDDAGQALDISTLDDLAKVMAILRWSALPGASRHHWGTDMDVYDRSVLEPGCGPELTLAECETGGPFYELHQWLNDYLPGSGFYRPYAVDRGGVGCEPWHLSFRPVAERYERALTPDVLRRLIAGSSVALADTLLDHLDEIHARFVRLPDAS